LIKIKITAILFISFFAVQCDKNIMDNNASGAIVAQIGSAVITIEEFISNYEFGFAHLKSSYAPKKSYLRAMINEKLLTLDGYKNNIHKKESIQGKKKVLTQELLIEYLLKKEIKDSIIINEDEIKEAINKSKVSFNVRFWTDKDKNDAIETYHNIKKEGFETFINKIVSNNPEKNQSLSLYETGYKSWIDFPAEMFEAIKYLPINEISEPILLEDKYWIFQVLDIRRSGVLESEYTSKAASFEKILYQEKLSEATTQYVSSLMMPKDVRTKSKEFNILSDSVWEWIQNTKNISSFKDYFNYNNTVSNTKLKSQFNEPLITYSGGEITINEFVSIFDFSTLKKDYLHKKEMMEKLNLEIAWYIRDQFLVQTALEKKIDELTEYKRELELWLDKWVFEEMRNQLPTEELSAKLIQLEKQFPVVIYDDILNSIQVIDSKKSKWLTVHNYKMGTNRMAVPIADGFWELAYK
jgi:hypothetical protein|tara:strand:+ start:3232 stop:4635 length:1404 start_codon:yes stop_codon:yes gene_type:complete